MTTQQAVEKTKEIDSLRIKMIELFIEREKEEYGCTTNYFVKETGADKKDIKKVLKDLKIAEAIEVNWCIDDDGMLSGRAYFLTYKIQQLSIREWLQRLKEMQNKVISVSQEK